jgi:hypothetical protein
VEKERKLQMPKAGKKRPHPLILRIAKIHPPSTQKPPLPGRISSSIKNREVLEAALDAGSAAAHRGHAAKLEEVIIV